MIADSKSSYKWAERNKWIFTCLVMLGILIGSIWWSYHDWGFEPALAVASASAGLISQIFDRGEKGFFFILGIFASSILAGLLILLIPQFDAGIVNTKLARVTNEKEVVEKENSKLEKKVSELQLGTPLPTPSITPSSTPNSTPEQQIDAIPLPLNGSADEFLAPNKNKDFVFDGIENTPVIIIYEPGKIEQSSDGLLAGVEFRILRASGESNKKWYWNNGSTRAKRIAFTPPSTGKYIIRVTGLHGFGKYKMLLRSPDKLDDSN